MDSRTACWRRPSSSSLGCDMASPSVANNEGSDEIWKRRNQRSGRPCVAEMAVNDCRRCHDQRVKDENDQPIAPRGLTSPVESTRPRHKVRRSSHPTDHRGDPHDRPPCVPREEIKGWYKNEHPDAPQQEHLPFLGRFGPYVLLRGVGGGKKLSCFTRSAGIGLASSFLHGRDFSFHQVTCQGDAGATALRHPHASRPRLSPD